MSRKELTIEERGEPSLVYFRRAHQTAPVELVIVEDGRQMIWTIRVDRLPPMLADLANFYVSGKR